MTSDKPTSQSVPEDVQKKLNDLQYRTNFAELEKEGVRHQQTRRFVAHAIYGADDQLTVKFTKESVYSPYQTVLADDGDVHYVEQDFVTIFSPGDKLTSVHRPVTEMDKWRFPLEWERYSTGAAQDVFGTPLSEWAALPPNLVKLLQYNNIRSVEQVADLTDASIGDIPNVQKLKRDAKSFLSAGADRSREIDELKEQIKALQKLVSDQSASPTQAAADREPAGEAPVKMRFGKPVKQ